ncbi:hypothetical protein FRC04_008543 [Tulasnella sp. 424]|nr:hypothetical protein FRC04_008543 [Tulasnella sp. 424]
MSSSFFGFDTSFPPGKLEQEDVAVYTWGEESYEGLGNALNQLDEQGDELNDETFGGSEPVGRDFDYAGQTLGVLPDRPTAIQQPARQHQPPVVEPHRGYNPPIEPSPQQRARLPAEISQNGRTYGVAPSGSTDPMWAAKHQSRTSETSLRPVDLWASQGRPVQQVTHAKFSPFDEQPPAQPPPQPRIRTAAEIEAEMRRELLGQMQHHSPMAGNMAAVQYPYQQSPQFATQLPAQAQQIHSRAVPRHEPMQPQFIDNSQQGIGRLERMLAAQHISEPPYREPTPSEVLGQFGHGRLPDHIIQQQILQQQQQHLHRPNPQYPRQVALDLINGHGQAPEQLQHLQQQQLGHDGFIGGAPRQQQPQHAHSLSGGIPPHLAEILAHEQPISSGHPLDPDRRNALMNEANRKIMEAEQLEAKRRRKAAKISKMAKYNDLMTQSDKDFITRIQVSQLVTEDPYSEDFYAQVYSSFVRSRMGASGLQQKSMLKFAGGAGVGVGVPGHRGAGRRENAMARMQTQVERMVKNAQTRQKDVTHTATGNPLQGALGKISGRGNKAAPRQMLQVNTGGVSASPSLANAKPVGSQQDHNQLTEAAGRLGREAMNVADQGSIDRQPPLTHRQIQVAIERLYDTLLSIEQSNREIPPQDDEEAREAWEASHERLLDELWTRSMVMVPVETSDPHPFIAILSLHKGKRLIPRIIRLLPEDKITLLLVLFVACFYQLDVVREAHVLDDVESAGSPQWRDVSNQTDAALMILPSITGILAVASLRLLTGLLNIMLGTGLFAVLQIVKSQPGIALLTAFMSRVDQLKHEEGSASPEDWAKWDTAFDGLLQVLSGSIPLLFPSRRLHTAHHPGFAIPNVDLADQIAWQFLAALAAIGTQPQQMAVVAEVKDMILEIVQAIHSNWVTDPNEARLKLDNVNILLNAIGLDHTMLLGS